MKYLVAHFDTDGCSWRSVHDTKEEAEIALTELMREIENEDLLAIIPIEAHYQRFDQV